MACITSILIRPNRCIIDQLSVLKLGQPLLWYQPGTQSLHHHLLIMSSHTPLPAHMVLGLPKCHVLRTSGIIGSKQHKQQSPDAYSLY